MVRRPRLVIDYNWIFFRSDIRTSPKKYFSDLWPFAIPPVKIRFFLDLVEKYTFLFRKFINFSLIFMQDLGINSISLFVNRSQCRRGLEALKYLVDIGGIWNFENAR
jgi:hypothetical protein